MLVQWILGGSWGIPKKHCFYRLKSNIPVGSEKKSIVVTSFWLLIKLEIQVSRPVQCLPSKSSEKETKLLYHYNFSSTKYEPIAHHQSNNLQSDILFWVRVFLRVYIVLKSWWDSLHVSKRKSKLLQFWKIKKWWIGSRLVQKHPDW
jgi:hypothetical protein